MVKGKNDDILDAFKVGLVYVESLVKIAVACSILILTIYAIVETEDTTVIAILAGIAGAAATYLFSNRGKQA